MLEVDLHTHSFFSQCGIHTHLEILERARSMGMAAVAVTDHGPALGPRISGPFFDRLHQPLQGIRLLKGMECNLLTEDGQIDLPREHLSFLDVVLLGIHPNTPRGLGKRRYTNMLTKAIEANPEVDIITHPNDAAYPVDFAEVAGSAADRGVAVELNNSRILLDRVDRAVTEELLAAALGCGCRIAVTSDMHALEELGRDEEVRPLIESTGFPLERIVTRNANAALAFIEERRVNKTQ